MEAGKILDSVKYPLIFVILIRIITQFYLIIPASLTYSLPWLNLLLIGWTGYILGKRKRSIVEVGIVIILIALVGGLIESLSAFVKELIYVFQPELGSFYILRFLLLAVQIIVMVTIGFFGLYLSKNDLIIGINIERISILVVIKLLFLILIFFKAEIIWTLVFYFLADAIFLGAVCYFSDKKYKLDVGKSIATGFSAGLFSGLLDVILFLVVVTPLFFGLDEAIKPISAPWEFGGFIISSLLFLRPVVGALYGGFMGWVIKTSAAVIGYLLPLLFE